MTKGNASCHTPNDAYRERYDNMSWDSDKKDGALNNLSNAIRQAVCDDSPKVRVFGIGRPRNTIGQISKAISKITEDDLANLKPWNIYADLEDDPKKPPCMDDI